MLLWVISGRFVGDVDDRRSEEVLQRHEEAWVEAATEAHS